MNHKKTIQGLVVFFTSLLTFILLWNLLLPSAKPVMTKVQSTEELSQFHYVAIGDSLTQGVGDTTNQGGFVPLLAQSLTNENAFQVTSVNYGVSGNTSAQILKRMQEKSEIKESLKDADLLTLTVGGNDVRKVVLDHFLDLSASSFTTPAKTYTQNVKEIIRLARAENPTLPIYVVGIYNPFYLNFPELTEMQTVVDSWNQTTENTVKQFENVYFVPINDRLYKGVNGQSGVAQIGNDKTIITNDALYSEDSFHPNNTGYEIMKDAILEKVNETKDQWKSKK
ncbi:SGNH/GDSL hydrolase family protein [Streptococcus sp. DD13]|uniref:SGNH/GDSL hydrolase family protein n=1 Tax=Streptococcus sp. DD13 TaxID=1777881 RepID=UPI0007923923|nr:SGNH/GDSL hydrolase family protein [Streptococcus sp. DD13]KXT79253.1 Lipase/Acylhydrolase with GDSL-like motif [Streptococcus sp. DD13]